MSRYDPYQHNRQSIRLKGYDYSKAGNYFVTICVKDKERILGEINDGIVSLSDIGKIADQCWQKIPEHFPNVQLDEYVIMPNHIHGVIEIVKNDDNIDGIRNVVVGIQNFESLHYESPQQQQHKKPPSKQNQFQKIIPRSLGSIVRGFKIGVTKWCQNNDREYFQWQRNFHDRIIRSSKELHTVRRYIRANPDNWKIDIKYI